LAARLAAVAEAAAKCFSWTNRAAIEALPERVRATARNSA
jgi:hypothetical protein